MSNTETVPRTDYEDLYVKYIDALDNARMNSEGMEWYAREIVEAADADRPVAEFAVKHARQTWDFVLKANGRLQ